MLVNVIPPPFSDGPFIDPSVVQATGLVQPSTSVKTSGSDKHKHKESKSSKKSALPATSPVDTESKISSDTTVQPVVPNLHSLYMQKLSKHLKIVLLPEKPVLPVLLPVLPVLLLIVLVLLTGSSSVTSQISSLHALTSTGVRDRPESLPDESERDDEPLFGLDIPVSGEEGEISESEDKREISEDMNYRDS